MVLGVKGSIPLRAFRNTVLTERKKMFKIILLTSGIVVAAYLYCIITYAFYCSLNRCAATDLPPKEQKVLNFCFSAVWPLIVIWALCLKIYDCVVIVPSKTKIEDEESENE